MTIKFFALFFIQKCNMQPVYVSLLAVFTPLGVSIAALIGQPLSKRYASHDILQSLLNSVCNMANILVKQKVSPASGNV